MQRIKSRIRAVGNTAKITKAMEMVSATKMRRSQESALASRPYAVRALELLRELSVRTEKKTVLLEPREVTKTLVVLVTADKGLAGSLNSNVLRRFEKEYGTLRGDASQGAFAYVVVGKRAYDFLARKAIVPEKSFTGFGDFFEFEETQPLGDFVIEGFETGAWDKVVVVSMHFRTTLRQEVVVRDLLPITYDAIEKTVREIVPEYGKYAQVKNGSEHAGKSPLLEYLIEPSPEAVLDRVTRHLVRMAVYHLVLEANASEHSARMVAMKNASDNARELIDTLTLHYNKARQEGITEEISEISGGAEALAQ